MFAVSAAGTCSTGRDFRLILYLFTQIERILEINELRTVTMEDVEAAREQCVIGPSLSSRRLHARQRRCTMPDRVEKQNLVRAVSARLAGEDATVDTIVSGDPVAQVGHQEEEAP